MSRTDKYIPALSFEWLTPLYDPLLRWGMREETFKRALIVQAQIKPGHRLLDLGCGTGTLTLLIKQLHPDSEVVGLDGDPNVLEIARGKAAKAGGTISFDHGLAFQLPYSDGSFDRVLSSLVFHHLTSEDKQRAAQEVFRVLRPGGELHVADLGQPHSAYARLVAPVMQRLEEASDNFRGRLPEMFRRAGFAPVDEPAQFTTIFGGLSLYRARKPT